MPQLSGVALAFLLLPLCRCFYVEISLADKNATESLKLICGPPATNLNLKNNHTVLWHGSQFGDDEQQMLSEVLQSNVLVPNMSINSSKRHLCYLLAPKNTLSSMIFPKKRVLRESLASVPVENGVCSPGYRIDQNRCFPCFPGSYSSGQDTECFLCPKDFYMEKKAADSCWPCPEGKKTLAQGADAEEACTYFDESGRVVIKQTPPWIIIFCLIGVIIAGVWAVIIILLVRHYKQLSEDDPEQPESVHIRRVSITKRQARPSKDEAYDTESEHEYAEIEEDDDTYEVPRKPSEPPIYIDLDAPYVPPKRKSLLEKISRYRDSVEPGDKMPEDLYESPIKWSSEGQYEIPIQRSSDHLYAELLDDADDHIYGEISDISNSDEVNERRFSKT